MLIVYVECFLSDALLFWARRLILHRSYRHFHSKTPHSRHRSNAQDHYCDLETTQKHRPTSVARFEVCDSRELLSSFSGSFYSVMVREH